VEDDLPPTPDCILVDAQLFGQLSHGARDGQDKHVPERVRPHLCLSVTLQWGQLAFLAFWSIAPIAAFWAVMYCTDRIKDSTWSRERPRKRFSQLSKDFYFM